jgi:hypothetical protein
MNSLSANTLILNKIFTEHIGFDDRANFFRTFAKSLSVKPQNQKGIPSLSS